MNDHASTTRRQFFGSLGGAAAVGVGAYLGLRGGQLGAEGALEFVDGSAAALDRAERIVPTVPDTTTTTVVVDSGDLLTFPVLPGAGVQVLDNFGGFSVSSGSCSHRGIDIFPNDEVEARLLVACVDGVIEGQRFLAGSQGNAWILRDASGVSYRYHHIADFEPGLEVGSVVRRGDVIGTMGSTGNANYPHLHFEVRPDGASSVSAVDPLPLLVVPTENTTVGPNTGCS